MGDTLLRLYHRLPAPMRSVTANLRGLYLRSWRYGPESERLIAEALERESLESRAMQGLAGRTIGLCPASRCNACAVLS